MARQTMKIVLVYGAFHTASCWEKLVAELEDIGFQVYTPTLPGHHHQEKSARGVTLSTYTAHIISFIKKMEEPVYLLGHSMGGVIISLVAESIPSQIKHLGFRLGNYA